MKVFAVSVVLLAVMLTGILINYRYINNVADEMNTMLDAVPSFESPECVPAIQSIVSYWESQVNYVGLSVSYNITDRLSEQALTLLAAAECQDPYGFHAAMTLLRDAITDMRRLETFSLENLM